VSHHLPFDIFAHPCGREGSGGTFLSVCECCFRVGDAVFGQVMGGMASHVVADARTLVPQPANIDAVEASTIPTTFLTAYECLMVAAGIQRGTRVLVH
jgi:NADPH:quinone reductase-like Zn-dependent oxidoreductase